METILIFISMICSVEVFLLRPCTPGCISSNTLLCCIDLEGYTGVFLKFIRMFILSDFIICIIQSTEFHFFSCACHQAVAFIICKSNPCYVCSCSCFVWSCIRDKHVIYCCLINSLICTGLTVNIAFLRTISKISYILILCRNFHCCSNFRNSIKLIIWHNLVFYRNITVSIYHISCRVRNAIS